jgi:hypothetical protein
MKEKCWQFCLILLISPFLLLAQGDAIAIADTFSTPANVPFTFFQAQIRDNKRIVIQWEVRDDSAEYFTIERSMEGKTYEAIGVLKAVRSSKYEFTDEYASRGQVYYRIRYTGRQGIELFSQPMSVVMPGATFFRFYPNPADKLLILRADYPIEVQVIDGFGKQRISKSLNAGPQIIDVSFLEKGAYILRITDKASGRQQFDKFLKN